MAFSENIPAWLKAIPEELVSLVDLPGLYGLNLYCRAATIGLGAVMGGSRCMVCRTCWWWAHRILRRQALVRRDRR